jgi:hypothetical protein
MTSPDGPDLKKRCPSCGEGVQIELSDVLAALLERADALSVVEALAVRPDARKIGGSLMGKARTQAKKKAGRKNVSKARRARRG